MTFSYLVKSAVVCQFRSDGSFDIIKILTYYVQGAAMDIKPLLYLLIGIGCIGLYRMMKKKWYKK